MATTELATATRQMPAVLAAIQQAKTQFEGRLPKALPNGMTSDKFMFGVATAVQKNPDLLKCTPGSVLLAAYEAAEIGINLNPSLQLGYIIPYGDKAQFQLGYRGMVQKTYETGAIASFFAEVVYARDRFERQLAPKRNLFHAPADGDRGEAIGAYALVQFRDTNEIEFEYVTKEQIERHRNHSKQPNSMMWKTFWEEGWRKTPIRILWKRLPLSNPKLETLAELIDREHETEREELPNGALQLETDSALHAMPKNGGTPAPAQAPEPTPEPAKTNSKADVFIQVDNKLTLISGNTYTIKDDLPKIGAKWDGKARVWSMPSGRTHELMALCEQKNVNVIEVDQNGHPIGQDRHDAQQDQREPGEETQPLPFS